ncbi:CAP-Gly domain-containing linker protein 1-like isoform X4 [Daktulosphaira vitifoliae]|uniref:CAP-Gly domain-containing linker protein 1-like isoform X4 n=1 Tax=Daktulosphaira vitifoliae TaxID=58002 RepID=UPI0021A9D4B0|nr:CAP-Gly domain-containing linker protein 1-like isoform X4 [Daktulosphaira vitifoliae]
MSENSENKDTKSSGLKPPTKIPTMGVSRIPSSSSIKLDGFRSTVTKLDSGGSKKLADMSFAGKQNGVSNEGRKSSSGSEYSMGDARRLSWLHEAGVRRSSGNSVILTEDTDNFIIGDRVWVGGTKPGNIAYIGETNFGTGDWAGVVLDEPIGKNDGSVGGTKYFQCPPKRGIFCRLTYLTIAPLGSAEDSMVQNSFISSKPLGFSTPMPKRQSSTVSNSSVAPKTVTKNVGQTPTSKSSSELKIGDRVIISSGQGSKLGVLRYRGFTQFAPGEWCGIELDDPLGKNNGSVDGIKYFECEDKFGLFTPIAKVSKSPMSANRMAANCAVHKTKRSPGSMSGSMISGITTTTMSSIPTRVRLGVASLRYKQTKLSEMDKLKTQLTQMKNENDQLRTQVTKAANQADTAEKKLEETLKTLTGRIQDHSMATAQDQLISLMKQIDEEKEKYQNLLFTNEEKNVANIELQNKNSELLIKIKELEVDLDKERNLAKDVEIETMKIFEKEEELCRVKEELESLKNVISNNKDELQKSVSNLSSEVNDKDILLNTLRQQLNECTQTNERLLKEVNEKLETTTEHLNKIIEEKNKKIEQSQEMIDQLNEGIKSLNILKNEEHDEIIVGLKNEIIKLKNDNKVMIELKDENMKVQLEIYEKKLQELNNELLILTKTKTQEISELQNKVSDLMSSQSKDKELINKLKVQVNATIDDLKKQKNDNIDFYKKLLKDSHEKQTEIASETIEQLQNLFDQSIMDKNKKIESCNVTLLYVKEQIIKSKTKIEAYYEAKYKEIEEQLNILIQNKNEIQIKNEQLDDMNNKLSNELKLTIKHLEEKSNFVVELEKKYNDLDSQQSLNKNELEKELSFKIKNLNDELSNLKKEKDIFQESHENYVREMSKTIHIKNEELKQNQDRLINLEFSLDELKSAKQNDFEAHKNQVMQLKNKIDDLIIQNSKLASIDDQVKELTNKLEQTLIEKEKESLSHIELEKKYLNEISNYKTSITNLQSSIQTLESKLTFDNTKLNDELVIKNKQLDSIKSENLKLLDTLKNLEYSKDSLKKKTEYSNTLESDIKKLNEIIEQKNKTIDDISMKLENIKLTSEKVVTEYNNKINEKDEEIKKLNNIENEHLESVKENYESQIKLILTEKESEKKNLIDKIVTIQKANENLEKQSELSKLQSIEMGKLQDVLKEKAKTIEDYERKTKEFDCSMAKLTTDLDIKLKEREEETKKLFSQELTTEKGILEKQNKYIIEEKEKENADLRQKLSQLECIKINLEEKVEQIKIKEMELKKLSEENLNKDKIIEENIKNIDKLNDLLSTTKIDFDSMIKEKEKIVYEVLKDKEKIELEIDELEKKTKLTVDGNIKEISDLRKILKESSENEVDKELMIRLELANDDIVKQREISATLEKSNSEMKNKITHYLSEIKKWEDEKSNLQCEMTKALQDQQDNYNKQINDIKNEFELLNKENILCNKEIEDYKMKFSSLQQTVDENSKNCEKQINMKVNWEEELDNLKMLLENERKDREHLEFRIQELTDENHHLNERIETSLKNSSNINFIKEKQSLERKYEETYSMLKIKENQIIVLQTELNSWKLKEVGIKNDLSQEKSETHLIAEKNEEIKMLNSIILGLHKKLSAVMETDVSDFEIEKNPNGLTKEEYQKLYKTAKNNFKLKECENMSLRQELSKVKTEYDHINEYKLKYDSLLEDKKKLQQIVVNYESCHDDNNKETDKSETIKILEEKDWQINLLNNIVADLHSKVSDNKFKIEALEKQILESGSDQKKKPKIRTTRLYCEHCEIFDAHDTDDCPKKPESPKVYRKRKVVDEKTNRKEEPFCVCCDMFGHTADECDSSLTF